MKKNITKPRINRKSTNKINGGMAQKMNRKKRNESTKSLRNF